MCVCHARARPAACTPACGPATPQPGTPCRRTAASCSLYTATAARRLLHPRARGARSGGTAAATHPRRSDPPPHGLLHLGCERLCCPVQSLALLPGLYEGGGRADGMLMVAQQAAVEPQWNPGSVARCCAHARTSLQQAAGGSGPLPRPQTACSWLQAPGRRATARSPAAPGPPPSAGRGRQTREQARRFKLHSARANTAGASWLCRALTRCTCTDWPLPVRRPAGSNCAVAACSTAPHLIHHSIQQPVAARTPAPPAVPSAPRLAPRQLRWQRDKRSVGLQLVPPWHQPCTTLCKPGLTQNTQQPPPLTAHDVGQRDGHCGVTTLEPSQRGSRVAHGNGQQAGHVLDHILLWPGECRRVRQ